MMRTMETGAAVAGVVSTFETGANLVDQMRKMSKKRRKRGEQAVKEKLLQEALESGEKQISDLFTKHLRETGRRIQVGDDVSREKLQHIAVTMQSELIRSLQIALKFDNAKLDLTKLQEDAVVAKRDALTALDELRSRIQESSRQSATPPAVMILPLRPSIGSFQTSMSSRSISSSSSITPPSTVTLPRVGGESIGSIIRFLSRRRHSERSSDRRTSMASSVHSPFQSSLMPTPEMLAPGLLVNTDLPSYEQEAREVVAPLRDVKILIAEPDTHLHPALNPGSDISRRTSTSTRNSTRSDFSFEKIAGVAEEYGEEVLSLSSPAASSPPPHRNQICPTLYATQQPPQSPTISVVSMLPSPLFSGPGMGFDYSQRNYQRPLSSHTSSSVYSQSSTIPPSHSISASVNSTPTSTPKLLTGRPHKRNNYWGFCKGAWTIRSDWRKGLSVYEVPTGMYNTKTVWGCKHCTFQGDVYGHKKPFDVDPRVYQAGDSEVRYRWLFLAKSHTKCKAVLPSLGASFLAATKIEEKRYGCVFCVGEGRETAVFRNVEALCQHLATKHSSSSENPVSEKLMAEYKCIIGRKAGSKEDFEVNIPHVGAAQ